MVYIKLNEESRYIVQIGCGCDQHGHNDDCTNAAVKAVNNAISNNCLTGLTEICGLKEPKDLVKIKVHIKIGAPYPESIDTRKSFFPFFFRFFLINT